MPTNESFASEATPAASAQIDARAAGDLLQFVSFRLGKEDFGVEILRVQEIIRMQDLTRIPNAPSSIEGVINLRGRVIPIIGLRERFGLESRPQDRETRIVVVEWKSEVFGFVVDSVSEVLRIAAATVEPPPRLSKRNNEYVSGVGKLPSRLILLLDVDRMMSDVEMAAIQLGAASSAASEETLVS
ncbi:MAG TPA: chemotaxis protein CheW [Candidatus Acidoferrum sp.]|nr:chemotaxis protein CheW [Candidatus Acidoferrum sp.]